MAPQKELTSKRPSSYSQWHRRNLPNWCYVTDGDWFEQRNMNGHLVTVAYIETMEILPLFVTNPQEEYPLWASKKALIQEISERMRIPCFVVRHKPSCDLFFVSRFFHSSEDKEQLMDSEEYQRFLVNLANAGGS